MAALAEADWGAGGADAVRFLIATNPGQELGPLARIASGGELSRLMLALKVVLSAGSPVPTLVFDEVDSGIGGATAAAVGERLARVAGGVQVLVVTHSPQVAARGAAHLLVAKQAARGRAATRVDALGGGGAARGDRPHAGRRDGHRGGAGGGGRFAGGAEASELPGLTAALMIEPVCLSVSAACADRIGSSNRRCNFPDVQKYVLACANRIGRSNRYDNYLENPIGAVVACTVLRRPYQETHGGSK